MMCAQWFNMNSENWTFEDLYGKIPYGEFFYTVKFPFGEISARWTFLQLNFRSRNISLWLMAFTGLQEEGFARRIDYWSSSDGKPSDGKARQAVWVSLAFSRSRGGEGRRDFGNYFHINWIRRSNQHWSVQGCITHTYHVERSLGLRIVWEADCF